MDGIPDLSSVEVPVVISEAEVGYEFGKEFSGANERGLRGRGRELERETGGKFCGTGTGIVRVISTGTG